MGDRSSWLAMRLNVLMRSFLSWIVAVYSPMNVSTVVRISVRADRVSRRRISKHSADEGCRPSRSVSSTTKLSRISSSSSYSRSS